MKRMDRSAIGAVSRFILLMEKREKIPREIEAQAQEPGKSKKRFQFNIYTQKLSPKFNQHGGLIDFSRYREPVETLPISCEDNPTV
jgi:hypothetical protein